MIQLETKEKLINRTGVEKESIDFYKYGDKNNFYVLEESNGSELKYIIYDCSDNDSKFNFQFYKEVMDLEEGISIPIIIFKDWNHERKSYWECYNDLRAKDRRLLTLYFEKKISIYENLGSIIEMEVEEQGINYLEYTTRIEEKSLYGFVYNISFYELKKLFNVTGNDLFGKNVRKGLKNNTTSDNLKNSFKEYIKVSVYNNLDQDSKEKNKDRLFEVLGLNDEILFKSNPKNFWFYHNGITIFSFEERIDRSGSIIRVNPQKVSVINGAQTLTNYFAGLEEAEIEIPELLKEIDMEIDVKSLLEKTNKMIKVKTIIIDGPLELVRPITYGLNTQIPILEEDIKSDSDVVKNINGYLRKKKLKILKIGEVARIGSGFLLLEFVKKYMIIIGQPGKSKNLRKSEINDLLKKIENDFKCREAELLKKFEMLVYVDEWWDNTKSHRNSNYNGSAEKTYCAYGKNYFGSYLVSKERDELDDQYLDLLFNDFIDVFKNINSNPQLGDFKKDKLFDEYKKRMKKLQKEIISWDFDYNEELKEYLNSSEISQYAIMKAISDYLLQKEIEMPHFRVINRLNKRCKENFAFPNSTFSEIYNSINEEGDAQYCDYEKSCFRMEIMKKFPVFIIDREKDANEKEFVKEVKVLKEFSFKEFDSCAKEVYNRTIEAFNYGDESKFPKISDNLAFHIRPKALSSVDTFEFSNGRQVVKRTFWANKRTVEEIIDKSI